MLEHFKEFQAALNKEKECKDIQFKMIIWKTSTMVKNQTLVELSSAVNYWKNNHQLNFKGGNVEDVGMDHYGFLEGRNAEGV